jgi:hypothetical protein
MGNIGPKDAALGTPVLAGAFRHVTNSYKHLLFRALLREVSNGQDRIPLARLASGMMEEAWWPGFHYRLNLGARDMVVARIAAAVDAEALRRYPHAVRVALDGAVSGSRDKLLRFVPQRFLRPWFADQTRGLADHRVDAAVTALSRASRPVGAPVPLYEIAETEIRVAPVWMDYLENNLAFVQGWSDAMWIAYLEARNPGVPGLMQKIAPALDRPSLADQRVLWRAVMDREQVACIYTGTLLDPGNIAIDHFIPRSFVSHDRMWNLTPTCQQVNLAKSDHLPDLAFVPRLARQHAQVARTADRLEGRAAVIWNRALDEVASDLRIGSDVLRRADDLEAVYADMLGGLAGIARRMGFPEGWHPGP